MADYTVIPLHSDGSYLGGYVIDWEGRDALRAKKGVNYTIWLDTPTGFALNYKGVPQFVVGVAAKGTDELQIRQMQRVFGRTYEEGAKEYTGYRQPRGLMPLDWQKLAVDLTGQVADHLGMNSVGIRASHEVPSSSVRITSKQASEMYDEPAMRLGFNQDEAKHWHKSLMA
jgi:hypothetical protein